MVRSRIIEPVKIGVIGLGRFGRLHALTLAGLAEAELVAVVARRQQSLDRIHTELPDVPGWLDLGRAVDESDAEAWSLPVRPKITFLLHDCFCKLASLCCWKSRLPIACPMQKALRRSSKLIRQT